MQRAHDTRQGGVPSSRHPRCRRASLGAPSTGRVPHRTSLFGMLTLYGACAVTFMMVMYALERRGPLFVLAFAGGCLLSSSYGFLAGTWPFGVVEAIWSVVALRRFISLRNANASDVDRPAAAPTAPERR